MMRRAVVLPQPLGPSSDRNSPAWSESEIPPQRRDVAERPAQLAQLDVGHQRRSRPRMPAGDAADERGARASPPMITKLTSDSAAAGFAFVWSM